MTQWEAEERLHESIRVLQDVCHWPYRAANESLSPDHTVPGASPKFSYDSFKRALEAVDGAARDFRRAEEQALHESQDIRAAG
jgi:hypothetical protein